MVKTHIVAAVHRLNLTWNEHPIRMINVGLLIGCLVAGWLLYAGKFYGAHEDLAHLSPLTSSNEWEFFVSKYYEKFYGNFAIWVLPWRLATRILYLSPETFPWWLPIALNLFYILSAPLNFAVSIKNLTSSSWAAALLFLVAFWAIWSMTPITFGITLFTPVGFGGSYTKAIFVLSVVTYLWSKPNFEAWWEKWLLLALYIDLISYSVALPASVTLLFGISILKIFLRHNSFRVLAKYIGIGLFVAVAILAMIFLTTNARTQYQKDYDATTPNLFAVIKSWYRPVPFGYASFPHITESNNDPRPWHKTDWPFLFAIKSTYSSDRLFVLLHTGFLAILVVGLSMLGIGYIKRFGMRSDSVQTKIPQLLSMFALASIFSIAFHAGTASYFITPHFPQNAKALPTLLVTLSWACFVWGIIQISDPITRKQIVWLWKSELPATPWSEDHPPVLDRATFLLSVCVVAVIVSYVFLPNLGRVIDTYRYEVWLGEQRLMVRQQIIARHLQTGQNNYLLLNCPSLFETSWAFNDYFQWRGYPFIQVIMEDAPNYGPAIKNDPQWVQLPCTDKKFISP